MNSKRFSKSCLWALRSLGLKLVMSLAFPWPQAFAEDSPAADEQPMLSPQETVETFQLPEGFEIRLVAAEPDLVNPMTMTLDEQGRVYVSHAHTYRYGPDHSPVESPTNPVVRLELDSEGRVARRVEVATGFENPVMGLAVRKNRLWATNLNEVFVAELDEQGKATSRQTIVRDAAAPWNPFGMYRLEFGPDGWLYLSVGDHPTSLTGTTNSVAVRGGSGAVFRFRLDGSEIEMLAQGMRAPFSFDIDPFGRRWLISNGEGNPNRLIQAIPGADYHFKTRAVDWEWLAGKHPLAPPVWENPAGAHTAVVAYRSDAFPEEYWGNLFVSNWGVHGFASANHVIIRHEIDQHGKRLRSEPFLTTTDPHFRPTQICHAPDGSLYVLDWYGRDDENDLTGRLYQIVYTGDDTDSSGSKKTAGLASRSHKVREQTRQKLLATGASAVEIVKQHLTGTDSLAAAESLWTLAQSDWPLASSQIEKGLKHPDWRVRRLAVELLSDHDAQTNWQSRLLDDVEPTVAIEAAMAVSAPVERLSALTTVLRRGAAKDPWLRYRAALEVARYGTESDFQSLLANSEADVRLAGLIALDEAFHEGSEVALGVLAGRIAESGQLSLLELLAIGERWPDQALVAPVIGQLNRDISIAEFAQGLAVLRRLKIATTPEVLGKAIERLLSNVDGSVSTASKADKIAVLKIVALDTLAPIALSIVSTLSRDADAEVRTAAHLALVAGAGGNKRFGLLCWKLAGDESLAVACRLDAIASLVKIEERCSRSWLDLLRCESSQVALAALRSIQKYAKQTEVIELLEMIGPELIARGEPLASELRFVQQVVSLSAATTESSTGSKEQQTALRGRLLAHASAGNPLLGRLAFRRGACSRCHLAKDGDTSLGPNLNGVAKTNGLEYLVDSVLTPSRVIKTGFMTELVVTVDGKSIIGKVSERNGKLTITTSDGKRHQLALADVEERRPTNQSLMPEALETSMSEAELTDLIAYLLEQ
jgi:putative membrane-bound dehydrogenase-like protein